MSTYNDYGIVLNGYDLAESDKILNIYTKENGLVRAVAKGAKKTKSKFIGKTDQLSCCYFHFSKGKNLDIVSDCSQVASFPLLRRDLNRLVYGILFLEVVSGFAYEMESESMQVYDLLYSGLEELQNTKDLDEYLIKFILNFLSIHGFSPQLETCVSCSKKISFIETIQKYPYSYVLGGLLCNKCSGFVEYSPTSFEVIKMLGSSEELVLQESKLRVATLCKPAVKENANLALALLREHINIRAKNKIKSFDLVFSL